VTATGSCSDFKSRTGDVGDKEAGSSTCHQRTRFADYQSPVNPSASSSTSYLGCFDIGRYSLAHSDVSHHITCMPAANTVESGIERLFCFFSYIFQGKPGMGWGSGAAALGRTAQKTLTVRDGYPLPQRRDHPSLRATTAAVHDLPSSPSAATPICLSTATDTSTPSPTPPARQCLS